MTIASEITRIKTNITNAYTSASDKGATLPDVQNSENLASCIDSITGGGGETVTKYGATADSLLGDIDSDGNLLYPTKETYLDFSGVKTVTSSVLSYRFYRNPVIKSVDFPNLTSIESNGLYTCFYGCSSLTTAPTFANLTSIESNGLYGCFYGCSSLTTAPTFANLTSIESDGLYYCFYGCSSLTTAPTFANLTSIESNGLYYCFYRTKITTLSFPSLKSDSFGTSTNQFNNMLRNVTGCTVHFPSNLESVIGSWAGVTSGFGGTNTTVLFDLPATE